jgi:hypothetical protein
MATGRPPWFHGQRAEERKKKERASESEWATRPGLAGPGKGRSGPREREERRTSEWAARLAGPSEGRRRDSRPVLPILFSFSKM